MTRSMNTYIEYTRQISKILTDKMHTVGKKYNLSKMETHALLFFSMDFNEPIASEFAKRGSYPKSNVSKALLNLSNQKFIVMECREDDRRYQEVKLLEKGVSVSKEIRNEIDPILEKLYKGINPSEKKIMFSAMDTLKQNIDEMMNEPSDKKIRKNND